MMASNRTHFWGFNLTERNFTQAEMNRRWASLYEGPAWKRQFEYFYSLCRITLRQTHKEISEWSTLIG